MATTDSPADHHPLTPSTLLPTLQPHLTSFTHSLPILHHQLGLPPSALESDLSALRDALLQTIEDQLTARKREVADWEARCRHIECEVEVLRGKVGSWGKGVATGTVEENKILPTRFELLSAQQSKLSALHAAKLEQLALLSGRLGNLVPNLPPHFFPSSCLNISPVQEGDALALEDVTPERFASLEREYVKGKTEITRRVTYLSHLLTDLLYLHTDLILPFPSAPGEDNAAVPSTSSTSLDSNPTSPSPMASASPEAIFARFIARLEEVEAEGFEPGNDLTGMEGIEPTTEVIEWAEQLKASLENLKLAREARIQDIYDKLEALWRRLGVADEEVDRFVEGNRGSGQDCVDAYEQELERMIELKRSKMSLFVQNAREEIMGLWDDLMYGEDEQQSFAPFYDDDHTEELLSRHEEEIERLREEREEKARILVSVKKWFEICDEQKELEDAAHDQTRLMGKKGDPGRLLREEKMRKRVARDKPKVGLSVFRPARYLTRVLLAGERASRERPSMGSANRSAVLGAWPSVASPPRATTPAEPPRKRAATPSMTNPSAAKRRKEAQSQSGQARRPPVPPLGIATNVYETPAPHTFEPHGTAKGGGSSMTRTASSMAYSKLGHGAPPQSTIQRIPSTASVFGTARKVSATEERIRKSKARDSFKPRPSVMGMSLRAGMAWRTNSPVKEEDEEG